MQKLALIALLLSLGLPALADPPLYVNLDPQATANVAYAKPKPKKITGGWQKFHKFCNHLQPVVTVLGSVAQIGLYFTGRKR